MSTMDWLFGPAAPMPVPQTRAQALMQGQQFVPPPPMASGVPTYRTPQDLMTALFGSPQVAGPPVPRQIGPRRTGRYVPPTADLFDPPQNPQQDLAQEQQDAILAREQSRLEAARAGARQGNPAAQDVLVQLGLPRDGSMPPNMDPTQAPAAAPAAAGPVHDQPPVPSDPPADGAPSTFSTPAAGAQDARTMVQAAGGVYNPNWGRVEDLFRQGIPNEPGTDQSRMWLMGLLGGLGNLQFQPGQRLGFGLSRAVAGSAQGYAGENLRQENERQQAGRERRTAQRELAGIVGNQEMARAGLSRQDRQFNESVRQHDRSYGLQERGVAVQERNADTNEWYRRALGMRALQQAGMDANPASIALQGAADIIRGDIAAPPGMQVNVGGGPMTVTQARAYLRQQMSTPAALRAGGLFATNPGMAEREINQHLRDAVTAAFAGAAAETRTQWLRAIGATQESRRRQGSTRVPDQTE